MTSLEIALTFSLRNTRVIPSLSNAKRNKQNTNKVSPTQNTPALLAILSCNFRSGGVLLGILGGGVQPGSPNPDPISDQKMLFSTPVVFRPDL